MPSLTCPICLVSDTQTRTRLCHAHIFVLGCSQGCVRDKLRPRVLRCVALRVVLSRPFTSPSMQLNVSLRSQRANAPSAAPPSRPAIQASRCGSSQTKSDAHKTSPLHLLTRSSALTAKSRESSPLPCPYAAVSLILSSSLHLIIILIYASFHHLMCLQNVQQVANNLNNLILRSRYGKPISGLIIGQHPPCCSLAQLHARSH